MILSNETNQSAVDTIRKYHEMVNAGGSAYFGSMVLDDSDSDDDNIVGRKNNAIISPNEGILSSRAIRGGLMLVGGDGCFIHFFNPSEFLAKRQDPCHVELFL